MGTGYDLTNQVPFRLMQGRLGIYNKIQVDLNTNSIEGVNSQATRLRQMGGNQQQERMIKDKRRSLDRAVWYSYQAAEVRKIETKRDDKPIRALINPNKLKQDYDDKILSIGFEYGFKCGDIFEWIGTNTYWLIYLQDLTELAYFRGDIRKCSYQISWKDEENQTYTTYAAIRGPVETKINYIQKHDISLDNPNYSLNLLLPLNDHTIKYFKRYRKFYLKDNSTCWRVEAVDAISTPGIIEISAVEYYANETEDDISKGIVGGLIEEMKDPNNKIETIIGETFIKIKKSYEYEFDGTLAAEWHVDHKYPVLIEPDINDPRKVTIKWCSAYSGQFELFYGNHSKIIIVESLF